MQRNSYDTRHDTRRRFKGHQYAEGRRGKNFRARRPRADQLLSHPHGPRIVHERDKISTSAFLRSVYLSIVARLYIYIYIYIYFAYDAKHKREVLLCRGGARMTYRATDLDISFSPYETPISRYSVFGDVVVHTSSLNYQLRAQRYTVRDYFAIEQLRDTVATACSYRSDRGGQGTAWKISGNGYSI